MTSSRSRWSRSSAVPVVLLVGLIAFHGYQVVALEDDPQRGGAFAMFATIDVGATRKVIATDGEGTTELELPDSLDGQRTAALDRPTEDAVTDLAEAVLGLSWTVEGARATASPDGEVQFDEVRLQVVGFAADGRTITRRVITDIVVGVR
jgi:hypothetical protein